jgi:hypothetical protein
VIWVGGEEVGAMKPSFHGERSFTEVVKEEAMA